MAGDTAAVEVVYTFLVTNTGKVPLYGVALDDPLLGGPVTLSSTTLAPGGTATGTATYELDRVTDVAAGEVPNLATVTGSTDDEQKVRADDEEVIEVIQRTREIPPPLNPSILVDKSVDLPVGEDGRQVVQIVDGADVTIDYSYVVRNAGNEVLIDLTLVDDKLPGTGLSALVAAEALAAYPALAAAVGAPALPVGGSVTVTTSYLITAEDVANGSVTNIAVAGGTGRNSGIDVDDDDTVTVDILEVLSAAPDIDLVKEALVERDDDGSQIVRYTDGEETVVRYRFTITNTGNAPLTDLTLVDDRIGPIAIPAGTTLAPGASMVVEADYTVTAADVASGQVTNVGVVTGTDPSGTEVSADDSVTVGVIEVLDTIEEPPVDPPPPVQPVVEVPDPPVQVRPAAVTRTLPRTGLDGAGTFVLGVLLAALGTAALLLTPRRRRFE